jgi:hypothetical protein
MAPKSEMDEWLKTLGVAEAAFEPRSVKEQNPAGHFT